MRRTVWTWLRRAIRGMRSREARDRDVRAELDAHVLLLVEEKERSGMSPEAARRAALLEAGGVEQTVERVRDARAGALLEELARDARFGVRMIGRAPVTASFVVAILAVTLGANTAVFSLARALLLRPMPVGDPERLVHLEDPPLAFRGDGFALSRTVEESGAVESAALYYGNSGANLEGESGRRISVAQVDTSFMRTLGVRPRLGRDFRPEEGVEGAHDVVLLSERAWRLLGGSAALVGERVVLSGRAFAVVGVMPATFDFPAGTDAWIPLPAHWDFFGAASAPDVIARLRPGMTLESAADRINGAYEAANGARGADERATSLIGLSEQLTRPIRLPVLLLFAAVGLVLVIGCANVAALMLARVSARRTEFAMRGALGASASRLVRQLLTEAIVLIAIAAGLGFALAHAGLDVLIRLFPPHALPTRDIVVDDTVLLYSFVVTALTTLLIAASPAVRALMLGRQSPQTQRATATTGQQRFRMTLLGAQIAVGVVLVVGAGLLTRSLVRLHELELGFDPARSVSLQLRLPDARYDAAGKQRLYAIELLERVRALPEVESAGLTTRLPLTDDMMVGVEVVPADRPDAPEGVRHMARYSDASAGYVAAIGAHLLRGADFTDRESAPNGEAIVSVALARRVFGTDDVVGRRVRMPLLKKELTVIGVIDELRLDEVAREPVPVLIGSLHRSPAPFLGLAVRTRVGTSVLMSQLRDVLHAIDPNVPPYNVRTMNDAVATSLGTQRTIPVVVTLFATMALLLCAAGTYGLSAELVVEQRRALCIRMALGARPRAILTLVTRRALVTAASGLVIGLLAGALTTRFMRALLFEIDPLDPLTFAAVPLIVLVTVAAATAWPAWRALRLDPGRMLRE